MKTFTEWEAIGDDLFLEANCGEQIQVSKEDYMGKMERQNIAVAAFLNNKYPDCRFKVSGWHNHDFGFYQEVEEGVEYEYEEDNDEE